MYSGLQPILPYVRDLLQSLLDNGFPIIIIGALLVLVYFLGRNDAGDEQSTAAPASTTSAAASIDAQPFAQPAIPSILIVDDSAVVRAKLSKLFLGAGYKVTVANDGLQALHILPTDFFSVLITDLEMPNLDGIELIASVQGSMETEDLPIVAITGHEALQAQVRDCEGLYGIFRKPWNDRELLKRVEALCQLRPRPSAEVALDSAAVPHVA